MLVTEPPAALTYDQLTYDEVLSGNRDSQNGTNKLQTNKNVDLLSGRLT